MHPQQIIVLILAGLFFSPALASASERSLNAAYNQWRSVSRPPREWNTQKPSPEEIAEFAQRIREKGLALAEEARSFAEKNPDGRLSQFAHVQTVYALNRVLAAGDPSAEQKIQEFVDKTLQNPKIPENTRVEVLLENGNTAFMKKAGMKVYTEVWGKDHLDSMAAIYPKALSMFPDHPLIYAEMLNDARHYARGDERADLVQQILSQPGAPAGLKAAAAKLLSGVKPFQIGAPVQLEFTSIDSEQINLTALRGKVVVLHFWATYNAQTCSEALKLKTLYGKFKDKGFEVLGVCLDEKKNDLRQFVASRRLPWPQHWDGRGWKDEVATQFEVNFIPQLWLMDRQGVLRQINPGTQQLQPSIEALLNE